MIAEPNLAETVRVHREWTTYKWHEFARLPRSYGGFHSAKKLVIVYLPCLLPAGQKLHPYHGKSVGEPEVWLPNVLLLQSVSPPPQWQNLAFAFDWISVQKVP